MKRKYEIDERPFDKDTIFNLDNADIFLSDNAHPEQDECDCINCMVSTYHRLDLVELDYNLRYPFLKWNMYHDLDEPNIMEAHE